MDQEILFEKMQRLWLEQLHREFLDICFQYRINLVPPVLELSGAVKQLGCWIPANRILKISHALIQNYSWNTVLMVLKHEMAHQVCSELYCLKKSGHGKNFQKACALLGVPSPYNQSRGDLESVVARPSGNVQTAGGRRLICRIRKLLALASSDNEHEAALAMQRATGLLTRYNLELPAEEQDSGYIRVTIDTRSKQMPTFRRMICAILRDYFFVLVLCASTYDAEACCAYKTVELLGRSENVPVAEHCYHFLEQQLLTLWNINRHRFKGHGRTARNSYYLGLLHGFAEKMALQVQSELVGNGSSADDFSGTLVCRDDKKLQNFVSFHFPLVQNRVSRGVRIYSKPYEEAVKTGKSMVLRKSVTEKTEGTGRLFLS